MRSRPKIQVHSSISSTRNKEQEVTASLLFFASSRPLVSQRWVLCSWRWASRSSDSTGRAERSSDSAPTKEAPSDPPSPLTGRRNSASCEETLTPGETPWVSSHTQADQAPESPTGALPVFCTKSSNWSHSRLKVIRFNLGQTKANETAAIIGGLKRDVRPDLSSSGGFYAERVHDRTALKLIGHNLNRMVLVNLRRTWDEENDVVTLTRVFQYFFDFLPWKSVLLWKTALIQFDWFCLHLQISTFQLSNKWIKSSILVKLGYNFIQQWVLHWRKMTLLYRTCSVWPRFELMIRDIKKKSF